MDSAFFNDLLESESLKDKLPVNKVVVFSDALIMSDKDCVPNVNSSSPKAIASYPIVDNKVKSGAFVEFNALKDVPVEKFPPSITTVSSVRFILIRLASRAYPPTSFVSSPSTTLLDKT